MTAKLEGIVRPFQQGDVFTANVLPPPQVAFDAQPDITVTWGSPIPLLSKAIGISDWRFGVTKLTEVSRRTKTTRVTNPTDSSQYVDVEKILGLTLKGDDKQTYEWNFNNG